MAKFHPKFDLTQLRILLIDDHEQMRKAIKRVLQGIGITEIHEASDGTKAITGLKSARPTLVICDLAMPNMDGFAVLETIRQLDLCSDVPILVVTGEGSKEDIVKSVDLGATDYLLKPFQSSDLEKKILKLIESYLNPDPQLQLIRETEALLLAGNLETAKIKLDAAKKIDELNIRLRFLEAYIFDKQNKLDLSANILTSILEDQPTYYRASALLANICLKRGLRNDAVLHMEDELKFNGKQPGRLVQLGRLMMEQSSFDKAAELFRKALLIEPRHKEALLAMGHTQVRLGKIDKGIYYFKRLRRNHPDSRDALEAIVDTCERIKDVRQAEFFLKDERAENPQNHDASVLLARVYFNQEKLEEAIAIADALVKSGKSDEAALILGLAEIKNKNPTKAITALNAITEGPNFAYACRLKAELYLAESQYEKAESAAQAAFQIEPWNEKALILQARSLWGLTSPRKTWFLTSKASALGAQPDEIEDLRNDARNTLDHDRSTRKNQKPSQRAS